MTKPPRLDEFQRIARFFAPLAGPGALGLKDDVALIDGPAGMQYVLKTDAIVEGIHFFPTDPPRQVAQKLLRVNLSDLAAKGAEPVGYLLTTALTEAQDEAWLAEFAAGLAEDQKNFGLTLLGGDSVRTDGALTLSATAIGRVAAGQALLRGGARPGNAIFVSGTLGDASLGLKILQHKFVAPAKAGAQGKRTSPILGPRLRGDDENYLIQRYRLPQPRLELGRKLVGLATAAMDISDGLVADLGHLCDASGIAAIVETAHLPMSDAARVLVANDPSLFMLALTGGDDYEILFTAPREVAPKLAGWDVTEIGRIEAGQGVTVLDGEGKPMRLELAGYTHF
ncbi:MAG TPA: thiamine-phosphate kinase [Stellaceae bacterium]|jgi:thiamine-monophosphate kinase|nr:thiamine-phosphate kinase [Stellaceae bacterium]